MLNTDQSALLFLTVIEKLFKAHRTRQIVLICLFSVTVEGCLRYLNLIGLRYRHFLL